jgi:hypothetical protein
MIHACTLILGGSTCGYHSLHEIPELFIFIIISIVSQMSLNNQHYHIESDIGNYNFIHFKDTYKTARLLKAQYYVNTNNELKIKIFGCIKTLCPITTVTHYNRGIKIETQNQKYNNIITTYLFNLYTNNFFVLRPIEWS